MSNDTHIPTPRTDAQRKMRGRTLAEWEHETLAEMEKLERELAAAKATIGVLENSEHPQVGEVRSFKLACASKDRLLREAYAENAALRKDRERLDEAEKEIEALEQQVDELNGQLERALR